MSTEPEPTTQTKNWAGALRRFLAAETRREAEKRLDWLHREFFSVAITQVLTEELRRGVPVNN